VNLTAQKSKIGSEAYSRFKERRWSQNLTRSTAIAKGPHDALSIEVLSIPAELYEFLHLIRWMTFKVLY